jgi:hypothetical protein
MTDKELISDFAKGFIKRTRNIITQYENYVKPVLVNQNKENEYYDATLLINCFYGLLMMPSKLHFKELKKFTSAKVFLEEQGFCNVISFKTEPEKSISLEKFVRSIRNGLGHWEDESQKTVAFEPMKENEPIKKIIVQGTIDHFKTEVKTSFDISSEEKRNKVLDFLELIYKPETAQGESLQ